MDYFAFCQDEALRVRLEAGMPVHRFFRPEEFLIYGFTPYYAAKGKERNQIVDMPIDEFLGLAEPIPPDDEKRHAPMSEFRKDVERGKRTDWEIPYLIIQPNEDDIWKVVGHDGRHRAMLLKSLGYEEIPVRLNMPKGITDDPGLMPEILWCQNDKSVERERDYYPFPLTVKTIGSPYVRVSGDEVSLGRGRKVVAVAMDEFLERQTEDAKAKFKDYVVGNTAYPVGCDAPNLKDYLGGRSVSDESKGMAPKPCTTARSNFAKNFVPNVAYRKDNTMPAATLKEFYSQKT